MDIVSHGLWGAVGFGRKNKRMFALAIFFGMLPDLLSFGVFTVASWLGLVTAADWSQGFPAMSDFPPFVHILYNITHSLVVFTVVATALWLVARPYAAPFLAYGFAVLLDIPTHSAHFFPTPFLWPLSDYVYDGTPWGEWYIFVPNVALLIAAYVWWYTYSKRRTQGRQGLGPNT